MKELLIISCLSLASSAAIAAQWLTLTPSDIEEIQVIQVGNSNRNPEGLYIGLKAEITGEAASYCSRKTFIAVNDPKLIDRAYSGLLYALSAQKTVKFYIDGPTKCLSNGPLATMFTLIP